jgi:hypothetical protein
MVKKSGLHQFAIILTALFFVAMLLSGCSKSVPGCDDGKTVKAVINTVSQDFKKDLAAITGMGGPGMELSDDEWRTLRAGMVIDLENIREHSLDEAAGKRNCAANVMIVQAGKKELIPVTYVTEMNKDTGDLKITLSGLAEYKKAQSPSVTVPE